MTTVNGLTAEAMQAIRDAVIVSAHISGDNLILVTFDDTEIDAGVVRGPVGNGPIGTIIDYIGTTAPSSSWLAMIGQTVVNAQTLYTDLWSKIPTAMKSGSSMIMPDTRGKVIIGVNSADTDFDTVGESGGSKTQTLTKANLPADTVTINPPATTVAVNPPSTAVTGTTSGQSADHHHGLPHLDVGINTPSGSAALNRIGPWNSGPKDQTDGTSGDHTHGAGSLVVDIPSFNISVDIASFESENLGSGTGHSIVQPYIVFMKLLKVL